METEIRKIVSYILKEYVMQETRDVKTEILEATIRLFYEKGLKFTMDDLAAVLRCSKKTIYVYVADKTALLDEMVDFLFDRIQKRKQEVLLNTSRPVIESIRELLGAMSDEYQDIDFRQLYILKEKYPGIYAHVEKRLESDWEPVIALLDKGMEEGAVRRFPVIVLQTMMQATLEQFFQRDILLQNGITYHEALQEVVNILVDGIRK